MPTATPSPTATPTPAPNANAEAGPDREISRGDVFTLNGSGSTDPDGDPIVSYTWTQVYGPDVTDGVGRIVGATPLITAPDNVSTVILELRVNDGHGDGEPDSIQINVMEHSETGFFVSGDDGSNDDGDGSRSSPFTSIPFAINQIQGPNYDIYVKSLSDGQSYLESETITPQTSISLYGGFGDNWVRDVTNNRTKIQGAAIAIEFGTVLEEAWFSGFDLTAADASKPGGSSVDVVVRGDNVLHIEDNTISAGNGAASDGSTPGGSSYGVSLYGRENVVVAINTINAGNGGAGSRGGKGGNGASATTNGSNGSGGNGGSGGKGAASSANGGSSGDGGKGLIPQDGKAGGGVGGGIGDKIGAGRVGDGGGGAGGKGGDGGAGGAGAGSVSNEGLYDPLNGEPGSGAGNGGGGAGGVGLTGGAGGGAGGGGQGGAGGAGGLGGGASIGILVSNVQSATIEYNQIVTQTGGSGGNGGSGVTGGSGSKGGVGAPNVCSFLGCNVGRSGDGGEGGGGVAQAA